MFARQAIEMCECYPFRVDGWHTRAGAAAILFAGLHASTGASCGGASAISTSGSAIAPALDPNPITLASNQSHPRYIAVDAENVYWTNDSFAPGIMRVAIAGGAPTAVATLTSAAALGLAVRNSTVYFTVLTSPGPSAPSLRSVMSVPSAGGRVTTLWSEPDTVFSNGLVSDDGLDIVGPAVDLQNLYWATASGSVWSMRLDGTNPHVIADPSMLSGGENSPNAIVVGPSGGLTGGVYWQTNRAIRKWTLTGGVSIVAMNGSASWPYSLAIDAINVYSPGGGSDCIPWRLPLAGGTASPLAVSQSSNSCENYFAGVATDGQNVYWTIEAAGGYIGSSGMVSPVPQSGKIMRVSTTGTDEVTLADGQEDPVSIAADAHSVYWTNYGRSGPGTVMMAPK
jgi:hypothetical protein